MTRRVRLLACFPLLVAAACTTRSSEPPEIRSDLARDLAPDVNAAQLAEFATDNAGFAADLYRQVRTNPGNLFMSPHSISSALAMTYAGAAGTTATQLAAALHFTAPEPDLHQRFNALDLALASRAAAATSGEIPFRLRSVNALFGRVGAHFEAPFLDTLAVNYGAGMHVLDFGGDPEGSRGAINGWVEDETDGKIQDLLPRGTVTTDTRLVLANAITFSAAWNQPFAAAETADRPFNLASGLVQVPTLHQNAEHRYGSGPGYRAAELTYDGGQVAMVLVVPDDLAAFESTLTGFTFATIDATLTPHQLEFTVPKFRFDAPLGLKDALIALGMTDAFDGGAADFSRIDGDRDLVITDVLHKGFVSIDEHGTEAAAATAVIIGDTSVPEFAQLAVDRPFLFYIRDVPTGAILFVGRVVDPR